MIHVEERGWVARIMFGYLVLFFGGGSGEDPPNLFPFRNTFQQFSTPFWEIDKQIDRYSR